jgi:hypothetical protein
MKPKIIGYSQPIAELPEDEIRVGGPVPEQLRNKNLEKEVRKLLKTTKKKKK